MAVIKGVFTAMEELIKQAKEKPAEQIAEALMRADGIPRYVVVEVNNLIKNFSEETK